MGLFRKVIRIKAEDSPNVRLALAQRAAGITPTGEVLVPGVLEWERYLERRLRWDAIRQCIGLDAEFWEGKEVLLFPPEWLNRAERIAESIRHKHRIAQAMGIDPAEGGDKTTMCVVDEFGIIEMVSKQTPDTDVIPREAMALMKKYRIPPSRVVFDRGGGGKQAADRLRGQGYDVQTVAFGEAVLPDAEKPLRRIADRQDAREERYVYRNRRAEMYGEVRVRLDPSRENTGHPGFGIPADLVTLRRELAPIPLLFDSEGRLELPPKHRRGSQVHAANKGQERKTLVELIGHSPDEADALALAIYGLNNDVVRPKARALGRRR